MSTESLDSLMYFDDFNDDLINAVEAKTGEPAAIVEPVTEPIIDPLTDPMVDPEIEEPDELEPVVEPIVTPTTDPEPTTEPQANENITKTYELLVENQMLMPDEGFDFDGTTESLATALKQSDVNRQKAIAQSLWEQLPEEFKPILQYGLTGGQDVESFLKTYQSNVLDIDLSDLSDENTKSQVLREYYKHTTKFDDNKIERHIAHLKAKGDADYTNEVYEAAVELKNIQTTQRQALIEQATLQRETEQARLAQDREDLNNVIQGMDIPDQRKGMIKSYIYSSDPSSNSRMNVAIESIIQNKEHFAQLADILVDSYDPKKGFNLEARFAKKGKTKVLDEIEKQLKVKFSDSKASVSGNNSTSGTPTIDWSTIF